MLTFLASPLPPGGKGQGEGESFSPGTSPRLKQYVALGAALLFLFPSAHAADPLFDLDAIIKEPVETMVLTQEVVDGVVFQDLEFTSRVITGVTERVYGIYAFPQGGTNLPAVFWSQGGMARASRQFPNLLARKGYACLCITLPHQIRNSFRIPFDTQHPKTANLTLLARDQLRGITVLAQRPEVDPDRLAVAGASYGGVFATLLAGVDPRIKAGFSFFGGGRHDLGTNLPQFQKMKTLADLETWNRTIDPAFRLKRRDIPFMWGVPSNDNWFYVPAVTQTYRETGGTGKRLFIMPYWQHGFLPPQDQSLLDFLDTTAISPHPRPAYNSLGPLRVREEGGQAIASFTWTGENPVVQAELIVSYGAYTPWLGWPHRAAFVFPAAIDGRRVSARLPIPTRSLPLVAWGNLTDTNQVTVSTLPLVVSTNDLAGLPVDPKLEVNCLIDGDLGARALDFYRRSGEPIPGQPVPGKEYSGGQAQRVDPPAAGAGSTNIVSLRNFQNVPGLAHRLTVRLKAEQPTRAIVCLTPLRPLSWRSSLVRQLVAQDPWLAPLLPHADDPVVPLTVTAEVGTAWKDVSLVVPKPSAPVDGYRLDIDAATKDWKTLWIDTIRMQPVWPE